MQLHPLCKYILPLIKFQSSQQTNEDHFWDDSGDEDDDGTLSPAEIACLTGGLNKVCMK